MRSLTTMVLFACMAASTMAVEGKGLQWNKNYGQSKRVAQAAKRPMLLVLEDPKQRKKLDETKLSKNERTILTKEKFELCRVDVTTDYGKRVAQAFGAKTFPYTVVTDDASKNIVYRKPGPMSQSDWTLALAKPRRTLTSQPITNPAAPATFQFDSFQGSSMMQPVIPASGTCFT